MRTTTVLLFAVILLLACPAEAQDDNLLGQLFRALLDLLCSLPLLDLFCNAGGGCDGYRPWWTLVQEVCDADTEFCEHPVDTCLIVDLGGTCVQIPDACTLNIDPVCGCDGITYDNDCVRQAARVSKASDGPCPATCGGIAGTACSQEDEFCEYEAGTCGFEDASGTCVHVSVVCPLNFVPVCGCDGTTYNNDCLRQAARVSKERDGACTTATTCGGIAGTICTEEDEFCDYDAGSCEVADASGECVPIPENCIEIYDPVCGCDGVTYGNDCERQSARVTKASDGPCPEPCGGIAGVSCSETDAFCEYEAGTCETADASGVCVSRQNDCPDIFDPVCGCDGVTYGNDCERQAARVSKASDGACPEPCGGIAGILCTQEDAFCEYEAGTCEFPDALGVCVQIPNFCTLNIDPVCGCDGISYDNDCKRQAAGESKANGGEC